LGIEIVFEHDIVGVEANVGVEMIGVGQGIEDDIRPDMDGKVRDGEVGKSQRLRNFKRRGAGVNPEENPKTPVPREALACDGHKALLQPLPGTLGRDDDSSR